MNNTTSIVHLPCTSNYWPKTVSPFQFKYIFLNGHLKTKKPMVTERITGFNDSVWKLYDFSLPAPLPHLVIAL